MLESEKVMVVSSRGNLDIVCTYNISHDPMLHRWAFLAELDSPPPANPPKITWILPKAAGAELGLDDEVVVAGLVPALCPLDHVFNLFPQLDAVIGSVSMIPMELTVFGIVSFCEV